MTAKNKPEIWNESSENKYSKSAGNISNNKIDDVKNKNVQNIFYNKWMNDCCIEKNIKHHHS